MARLFCFASRSLENIQRGFNARRWAVATTSETDQRTRRTKAQRNVRVGDFGLLYCNPAHAFTVPFRFESEPDPRAVEKDTWPEPWIFPFSITPLGHFQKMLPADEAARNWPVAKRRFNEMRSMQGGISAAMHLTGTMVFVPLQITTNDWATILADLGD